MGVKNEKQKRTALAMVISSPETEKMLESPLCLKTMLSQVEASVSTAFLEASSGYSVAMALFELGGIQIKL